MVTDGTGGAFVGWTGFDQLHDPARIQRVRGDGVFGPLLSGPASKLRIDPSFPNPSSGVVYCDVQIATDGDVVADVHDIRGRRIASLVTDASGGSGAHRFRWDGYDQHGTVVSPGIYFLVVRTSTETAIARIAIVR